MKKIYESPQAMEFVVKLHPMLKNSPEDTGGVIHDGNSDSDKGGAPGFDNSGSGDEDDDDFGAKPRSGNYWDDW